MEFRRRRDCDIGRVADHRTHLGRQGRVGYANAGRTARPPDHWVSHRPDKTFAEGKVGRGRIHQMRSDDEPFGELHPENQLWPIGFPLGDVHRRQEAPANPFGAAPVRCLLPLHSSPTKWMAPGKMRRCLPCRDGSFAGVRSGLLRCKQSGSGAIRTSPLPQIASCVYMRTALSAGSTHTSQRSGVESVRAPSLRPTTRSCPSCRSESSNASHCWSHTTEEGNSSVRQSSNRRQ